MNYLDGFSGYGGFHLGLEQAGFVFDKVYFSEIDKHAIANYKYNFPNAIYAGSITTISRSTIPDPIDLFTFGWPCHDNSIAGKRKGQSGGTRSGLLSEAGRVINEFKPGHFLAENVPGLLSVNKGIDYIEAVEFLSYLNESLPQYTIEMQLLNTSEFLPHNRERLFFIGHLRERGYRQVFPVHENTKAFPGGDIIIIGSTIGEECTRHGQRDAVYATNGIAGCLKATEYKQPMQIMVDGKLRKITPTECARLQGLPDNWLKTGSYDGEILPISDSQQYRLSGNGVSVPIIKMIGEKLLKTNY